MRNNNRQGKWQPFDALSGFKESLSKQNYEHEKTLKPILSPDKIEQINDCLMVAIDEELEVYINYFYDGYLYNIEGSINKVDLVNKTILVGQKNIDIKTIVDCKIK